MSDGFVPASQGLTKLQPELQPDGVDGGAVRSAALRGLRCVRDARGTLGPANADAAISANSTVSKDISLLDQGGSGPLGRDAHGAHRQFDGLPTPALRGLVQHAATAPAVRDRRAGKNVEIDTSLSNVLMDLFGTSCRRPAGASFVDDGNRDEHRPTAVSGYLAAAQTQYQDALTR